jgi:hypothetical protein
MRLPAKLTTNSPCRPTNAPMKHLLLDSPPSLETLLRPETPLERHLLTLPEFRHGLLWGEPRFGHPEGRVALHVREVLDNVELIRPLAAPTRQQLRLIAFTHDTFKFAEDRSRPRDWTKHHGLLARRFLEQYTEDRTVLDITETHDDAYYAWLHLRHPIITPDGKGKTLEGLLERVQDCLQEYYLFFKCDTQTGDKNQAPLKWFERSMPGIERREVRSER